MAKTATAQKVVGYRRCVMTPKQNVNLQQLVLAALLEKSKPADRYEPLNASSSELRCIGQHTTIQACLCGYLTSFERGASQPVIGDDANAAALRLGALPPPAASKGAVQQQYVPGVVYFAIFQNHVAIVQSSTVRTRALEAHLSWLLKERTSSLPAGVGLALSDEAQKATKEKIRRSHVKSISLGQPLMAEVTAEEDVISAVSIAPLPGADSGGKKKPVKKFRPGGPMVDLIRSYFDDQNSFEKLGFDEVFDGNLEVWIEIRYPKRSRSKPEDAMRLMDTLGIALRDVEGDQVALKLADGKTVTGAELKIASTIDVPMLANRLPDENKLWEEMSAWLMQQIANGVVDP